MAVTFNKDFFEYLESADLKDDKVLQEVIKRSVQTKADVVAQDEKEHGIRAALNYGHTFGHVIENETKYTKYLHGEAVAIGMVMANETAVAMGLMSIDEALRVKKLLKKYNLETSYNVKDTENFYQTFFLDKKSSDSKITFIIPVGIGDVRITDECDKELVLNVLNRFGES
jgi:3-dehydroquinate synthase